VLGLDVGIHGEGGRAHEVLMIPIDLGFFVIDLYGTRYKLACHIIPPRPMFAIVTDFHSYFGRHTWVEEVALLRIIATDAFKELSYMTRNNQSNEIFMTSIRQMHASF
jgi:hypothetical protein